MTTWNHGISWSKLKLALDCPRQLQHTIDKKPHGRAEETYHTHLGTLVQKTFELYFNRRVNRTAKGRTTEAINLCAERIVPWYLKTTRISYPHHKGEDDLTKEATELIAKGHETMRGMGLLNRTVRSEVKLNGMFRGLRLFALVDFLVETPEGDLIYDGKGHQEKNADPRQILYYALNRASAGRTVKHAGLIYWRHGFEEVDCSPAALRHFIETELTQARPTLDRLKQGTSEQLETKPSEQTCRRCPWRHLCEDSPYRSQPTTPSAETDVAFGDPTV